MSDCVLIFSPHPDDAERHMGGTIAQLAANGTHVVLIALTAGQMGTYGDAATRKAEFEAAATILGAEPLLLDFMDTRIADDDTSRLAIAHVIRTYRPTLVIAPFPERGNALHGVHAHVDHWATGKLVTNGVMLANVAKVDGLPPHRVDAMFYYLVPPGVEPTLIVGIRASEMATALRAVAAHTSQAAAYHGDVPLADYLVSLRRTPHRKHGVKLPDGDDLSEVFVAVGPTVLGDPSLTRLFLKS